MAIANPNPNGNYSFADVQIAITYPGGTDTIGTAFNNVADVGQGGFADEGIRITRDEKGRMKKGADGSIMHVLLANQSGRVTLSFLKTSPANAILNSLYNTQSINTSLWGQMVFQITEIATGDVVNATAVGFAKAADNGYDIEGRNMEWEFNAGFISQTIGNGGNPTGIVPPVAA